jgi:hypothetical protein
MWGAEIVGKTYAKNGALTVQVKYTKSGADPIIETIDMTGGSGDVLDIKIRARLETLNTTDSLVSEIKTGPYTPKQENESARDQFLVAYRKLERLDRLATLGIIQDMDPEYIAAQEEAKKLFSIDFLDVL